MRHYEIVALVHPDQSDHMEETASRYKKIVEDSGGTVHRFEDWGRRKLAYPIQKQYKAGYFLLNIECDSTVKDEIENAFRYNDAIIRSLVIRMDNAVSEPSPMLKRIEREKAEQRERDEKAAAEAEEQRIREEKQAAERRLAEQQRQAAEQEAQAAEQEAQAAEQEEQATDDDSAEKEDSQDDSQPESAQTQSDAASQEQASEEQESPQDDSASEDENPSETDAASQDENESTEKNQS